jgi:peptidase E
MEKKNILFIKNINLDNRNKYLDYFHKYFNINLTWINSTDLIDKDYKYLNELITLYDIIIIGGGPR